MTVYMLTSMSGAALTTSNGTSAFAVSNLFPSNFPQYRLLEDHYLDQQVFFASAVLSENDYLPLNWIPTPNVDPLNTTAVQNFYAQGPRQAGLIRDQWQGMQVFGFRFYPITYWKQIPGTNQFNLTGLGSGLPPIGE